MSAYVWGRIHISISDHKAHRQSKKSYPYRDVGTYSALASSHKGEEDCADAFDDQGFSARYFDQA